MNHFDRLFIASDGLPTAAARFDAPLPIKLLCVGVLPAFCAEIAFRGFILSGLLRRYSPGVAILITSVLYGVSQLVTPQMIIATVLGVILGIVTTRTGSVVPAIAMHAIHNCLLILSRAEMPLTQIEETAIVTSDYPIEWIVLGALFAAMLIGWLASRPTQIPPCNDAPAQK
jgi:membrane protease YdiL (CAAX protease family)